MKIGVLADNLIAPYQVYDLISWIDKQKQIDACVLIIQNVSELAKYKRIKYRSFKENLAIISFKFLTYLDSFLIFDNLRKYRKSLDISIFFRETLIAKIRSSKSGFIYLYDESSIKKIREMNLDILLNCGSGILHGDILSASKYGILSIHHGDNNLYRGGPPGFWEVYFKKISSGCTIQILNEELDGGKILFRGSFYTKPFYTWNQLFLWKKGNFYLKEILKSLLENKFDLSTDYSLPYSRDLYKIPGIRAQIKYFLYCINTLTNKFIRRKILRLKYRFGVSYSMCDWNKLVMRKAKKITSPKGHFLADPFVVSKDNHNYIFVEDYSYKNKKGSISVYKVNQNSYKLLGTVLEEEFHLSYPFIFKFQNKYFMVPESHKKNCIRLYESIEFPMKWKFKKILIDNISARDTTIFYFSDYWWLFTNTDNGNCGDGCSELSAFYTNNPIDGEWTPHDSNPIIIDPNKARMGGILHLNDSIFRVAQCQGFNLYGKSTKILRINLLDTKNYKEELVTELDSSFYKSSIGTHHFHSSGKCTAFDYLEEKKIN